MIEGEVEEILNKAGVKEVRLEVPKVKEFGDIAFPCFDLAKQKKQNPQKIAEEIVRNIKFQKKNFIEKIEAKSGYVNFFFDWKKISAWILKKILSEGEKYGKPIKIEKKKIMIEHTSTNPNKALHIGHIRNSCLGDCLARILSFYGHDVIVANYIDDSGAQIADVIVGFKFLNIPLQTEKKFDQYCGDEVYVKVNKLYETNPEILEKRKFVIKKIEEGNNEIAKFSDEIVHKILLEQLKTCWRLNIFYDLVNKETDIIRSKLWEKAFNALKRKSFIYFATKGEKAGCWMFKLSDLNEFKKLKEPDVTLVRSDGTVVYVGKDIAYAMWKHGLLKQDFKYKKFVVQPNKKILWSTTSEEGESKHPSFKNVDISINVIDVRQSHYQNVVKSVLNIISKKTKNYIHYAYEVVSLSSKTANQLGIPLEKKIIHMAGRKGWFINADTVLDALFKKALGETKKRNLSMSEVELREIAEKIAVSSLRYDLVKVSPEKIIVFDLDEALRLQGNTGPYLQYAYTRCHNILKKADKWKPEFSVDKISIEEKNLLKSLMEFPEIVERSAKDLKPHYIANYAYNLATIFDRFYEACPVLKAETDEKKNFRLTLVEATKTVLGKALELLGIETLEKM
ncbi:MAG: arginine--tRNA ligase [Candidatus Aenigmatarchaeota archaeon]